MRVYTFSEARQRLAEVLDRAKDEEVVIRRRSGDAFRVVYQRPSKSPLDIPGVKTSITTEDILEAIRESRERDYPWLPQKPREK
jgi:prevent-host-death family protein